VAVLVASLAWKAGRRVVGARAAAVRWAAAGWTSSVRRDGLRQPDAGGRRDADAGVLGGGRRDGRRGRSTRWRWAAWVYLVAAGSLVAFSAFMVLLQRTPTAVSSSYAYVNPVIGMVLGATLGGEAISTFEWAAAALVTGSVLLMLGGRRQPAGG
jgi:hypothetical protein